MGTITAFFTSFYSLRLIYLTFIRETRLTKPVANTVHESSYGITIPLTILSLGSIFLGYITKDLFVGAGSPLFDHVMLILPSRNSIFLAEFLPFYIKNLPFFLSLISIVLLVGLYLLVRNYAIYYQPLLRKVHQFVNYK